MNVYLRENVKKKNEKNDYIKEKFHYWAKF